MDHDQVADGLADDCDALDRLSDDAIDVCGLDPDSVQRAITKGVNRPWTVDSISRPGHGNGDG